MDNPASSDCKGCLRAQDERTQYGKKCMDDIEVCACFSKPLPGFILRSKAVEVTATTSEC